MLRADNTSVIVAYFDPPGIHKESSMYKQPSDVSVGSTLKATSDGEEDSDAELEEMFPPDDLRDEESHQANIPVVNSGAQRNRKPALKRMSPASTSPLTTSTSQSKYNQQTSPKSANRKSGGMSSKSVMDAENDPLKVSIITVKTHGASSAGSLWNGGQKRSCSIPNEDNDVVMSPPVTKKPCLAVAESSQVADSPLTTPRLQLSPSSSSSSSNSGSEKIVSSPLWPSTLGEDLHSDNAMCQMTSLKTRQGSCPTTTTSPSPLSSQNKPSTSSASSCQQSPASRRSNTNASSSRPRRGSAGSHGNSSGSPHSQRPNKPSSASKLNTPHRRTVKKGGEGAGPCS